MKLNKIARAIAVIGLTLSAAAWSALPNQPDPSTATGLLNGDGTQVTVGTTLTDPSNGNFGAQTGTVANGNAPVQGTIGGPGGVSGKNATWGTGLLATPHDFASGNGTPTGSASVGLCTFCHTPHKASSTLLLWNHTMSANTFQWDVAATTAGTALPGFTGNTYKGPSAKCLSCHDGSIAVGDIGWFNQNSRTGTNNLNGFKVGATGNANGDSMLVGAGGNLTGTHPVAIPYPLNGAPNVYNASTTGARLATNDFVTDPTANNMRLYSDVGGGQIVGKVSPGQTGMECSTCHDPHNKASRDDFFLRGALTGSTQASGYICLQCHVK